MCTVTFIARRRGYCLGMNRDEKRVRPMGLPPARHLADGRVVLHPSEPGGGTWIALNESGVSFALINWYSIGWRVIGESASRGEVVRKVRGAKSPEESDARLDSLVLGRINPFRLIGIFPETGEVVEWRWDLRRLVRQRHRWKMRQWISSGHDEPLAQRVRGATFRRALRQDSARSLDWLRRLHRSHAPAIGPCSTCMHRADAVTVSYTEISVTSSKAAMRHHAGAPCGRMRCAQKSLRVR